MNSLAPRGCPTDVGGELAPPTRNPELPRRILESVEITDRRGYGLSPAQLARLLYGGTVPVRDLEAVLPQVPGVVLVGNLVLAQSRSKSASAIRSRAESHGENVGLALRLASDFTKRLVGTCPLVRFVGLSGSASSGGYDPRDDVDLNLVAEDGAKYTVYLWGLALSAVTSLRNLGKATDEMGSLPLLPKIICINVVWEDWQVRPFARRDKWLAYELLVTRPLWGGPHLRQILAENSWIAGHFPQLLDPGFLPHDLVPPEAVRRRPGSLLFGFLGRHPAALRVAECLSRRLVLALHKAVSVWRSRSAGAFARQENVNFLKRPYSVYDVPARPRQADRGAPPVSPPPPFATPSESPRAHP